MVYKLDLKNRKILYELDINSRQSFSTIARKVGLSKTALINRMSNLQKEGIIKKFHTVIDTGKLGYMPFRLLINLQNASPEKENEILGYLKEKPIVTWLVSIQGEYDIGALVLVKKMEEVNSFWEELLNMYGNYIEKRLLTLMTSVHYFSRAYLLDEGKKDFEVITLTFPNELPLDEKDREILKILAQDSRALIIDIASKVRLTPKTIIEKIKKFEKKKIIVGYKTVFDLEKIGYSYFKVNFLLNNITIGKKRDFKLFIKNHPNIIYEDEVLGGDDIEIEIQIENMQKLREVLDAIKEKYAGIIKDYRVLEYYKEHKYLFLPVKI